MTNGLRIGGVAALINAIISFATLIVAFGLIGIDALTDRSKFIQLALNNPTPLIIQDGLKLVSVIVMLVLIRTMFGYLRPLDSTFVRIATFCGLLSALLLLANGVLSLYAVTQLTKISSNSANSGEQLNAIIAILGLLVVIVNGIWYIGIHRVSLQSQRLPRRLCYLGLCIGVISFLPPLALVVLLLTIVWSIWLGLVLLRQTPFNQPLPSQVS